VGCLLVGNKNRNWKPFWVTRELEPDGKVFLVHSSSIPTFIHRLIDPSIHQYVCWWLLVHSGNSHAKYKHMQGTCSFQIATLKAPNVFYLEWRNLHKLGLSHTLHFKQMEQGVVSCSVALPFTWKKYFLKAKEEYGNSNYITVQKYT